jgi:hypothetical protein
MAEKSGKNVITHFRQARSTVKVWKGSKYSKLGTSSIFFDAFLAAFKNLKKDF